MGNCMNKKGTKQSLTLAILGLDNAGKTVTTKGLQGETLDTVAPTLGFSSVDFQFGNYDVTLFDLGGGKGIRDVWKNYFAEIYGLVYVVDSSDRDRIGECHSVLNNLLQNKQIEGKPMLLLANKQDKSGALDEVDICDELNLEELVNQHKTPCRLEPCSAIIGQGKKLDKSIKDGMQWLLAMITKDWETLHKRVQEDIVDMKERQAKEKKERTERVRKIREEREKKEKQERMARGEAEKPDSDDDAMGMGGGPFQRLNREELERKERQLKEEKRKKKERESGVRKSKSEDEYFTSSKTHVSNRHPSREEEDADTPVPSQKHLRSLHALDNSEMFPSRSPHHSLSKGGQFDSPRPNRRFQKTVSRSYSSPSPPGSEEENGVITSSSLSNGHWLKQARPTEKSYSSSGLAPLGGELGSQKTRGVLSPLGPLEPLEALDLEAIEKKNKKKKKKAKKNQTVPDYPGADEHQVSSAGWPGLAPRASRSPRLDTVQEPDNESENGGSSRFSKKFNLIDELPEIQSSRSYRRGPNTDYDDNLIT